jgi:transcriptional regulator with XRE-family HTH domain
MLRLRVRELAEERGYNMSSLSRASDVSFTTIKRYFRKPYSYANTDTLEKIALTLGVEVGDLIERVPDTEVKSHN